MEFYSKKLIFRILVFVVVNPQRACAGKVTVLGLCISLSVCLSVTVILLPRAMQRTIGNTNGFSATQVTKNKKAIFLKLLRSKVMAWNSSEKASMLMSTCFLRPVCSRYEINKARQLLDGQLVNRALTQRAATEADSRQALDRFASDAR